MRLFENANYPFHAWRTRAYIAFAAVVLIGLFGIIRNIITDGSWLNYSVEFTGGTLVQLEFDQPVPVEELRATAERAGEEWEITNFGSPTSFIVRTPTFEQDVGQDATVRMTQVLSQDFDPSQFQIVRTDAIGPRVGDELQQRALLAIIVSFVATLIYLAIRFEWRFGLAAILATSIDILVSVGYMAVTEMEISLGTVAALLTIVGYSLNDTIVVFDRIRENLAKPHSGESYEGVLNRSINETLSRTALTGGGTLATLLALFFLGGPVIQPFALVLILGIVSGTFSSIFVAAPILYEIEKRTPKFGLNRAKAVTSSKRRRTGRAAV
jgi:preprotein translocase subunit SecF